MKPPSRDRGRRREEFAAGLLLSLALLVPAALAGCQDRREFPHDIRIPKASDWTDHDVALAAGPAGSWDSRFSGAISPATVVKRQGTYLLYYIGADGDRERPPGDDRGPRHRALGVATSRDGIHFTRHDGNPIVTHIATPDGSNAQEEGVFSAAALGAAGRITLYFAGLTMTDGTRVRSDIYQTTSGDGFRFSPPTKVLDATASGLWGNGGPNDEICPAGLFRHDGTWNLYYLTKNREQGDWDYGIASGSRSDRLDSSRQFVLQDDSLLGGGYRQLSPIKLGPHTYALFMVNYDPDRSRTNLEMHLVSANRPDEPGQPQVAYSFPGEYDATVFLDEAAGRWLMYYREEGDPGEPIRVKSAPLRRYRIT